MSRILVDAFWSDFCKSSTVALWRLVRLSQRLFGRPCLVSRIVPCLATWSRVLWDPTDLLPLVAAEFLSGVEHLAHVSRFLSWGDKCLPHQVMPVLARLSVAYISSAYWKFQGDPTLEDVVRDRFLGRVPSPLYPVPAPGAACPGVFRCPFRVYLWCTGGCGNMPARFGQLPCCVYMDNVRGVRTIACMASTGVSCSRGMS